LAGPANRQGRIAADNVFGRSVKFRGTQGTAIVGVFDRTAAMTGASEKSLRRSQRPFRKIYAGRGDPGRHDGL
jgi:NADPH-dependent 2,4-dienoyl-CoA reductase/sulfur reductase-like enzyme